MQANFNTIANKPGEFIEPNPTTSQAPEFDLPPEMWVEIAKQLLITGDLVNLMLTHKDKYSLLAEERSARIAKVNVEKLMENFARSQRNEGTGPLIRPNILILLNKEGRIGRMETTHWSETEGGIAGSTWVRGDSKFFTLFVNDLTWKEAYKDKKLPEKLEDEELEPADKPFATNTESQENIAKPISTKIEKQIVQLMVNELEKKALEEVRKPGVAPEKWYDRLFGT